MGNIKSLDYYVTEISNIYGYFPYIILNEDDFINGRSIMKLKCKKCNNIMERKMNDLLSKNKINKSKGLNYVCKGCSQKEKVNKLREKGKEDFFKIFNASYPNMYEILSEYINEDSYMKFRCKKCNNEFSIRPCNIKNNIRNGVPSICKYCNRKRISKDLEKNKDYFIKKLKEKNKDKEYDIIDFHTMSKSCNIKCTLCNYSFKVIPNNLLKSKKHYCPNCNRMIRDKRPYKERCLEKTNGKITPLETYKGRNVKILHKCLDCNYEWSAIPNNFLEGSGCPNCRKSAYTSKGEKELFDFLNKNYDGEILENNRGVIYPKELDIYIPDKQLAIEYCGLYWHGNKQKENNYHLNKTKECLENNIRLIHLFEDEWLNKRKIVENKLLYILHCNKKKSIYARKCWIKEINTERKNKFLDKYHIQGKDNSSIKLGLFTYSPKIKKTILVSVMTFCKPRKALGQNKESKYDYELSRFVSTYNYNVIGAFSKLFKYFERNYEWENIITYADKRWSEGEVYLVNGWIHEHDSKPNYWYVDNNHGNIRYYRYNFRKNKLKELFPNLYSDNKTEKQIMEEANYYRIYDCGNMVFSFSKNK